MQTLEACSESPVWEMRGVQGKSMLRMMPHAGSEADLEMPLSPMDNDMHSFLLLRWHFLACGDSIYALVIND